MKFFDALLYHCAVFFAQRYVHALAQFAAVHTADGYTAHIIREVERGYEHLGVAFVHSGFGYVFDDCIEQGQNIVGGLLPVGTHPAFLGRAVDCGEVELFFSGIEIEHKIEYHLLHFVGTAVRFVDLINHHHGLQPHLNCLLEHESGLRHRPLKGVDQQQTAVGHIQHTLYLTAEVGVSRGIDNVDFIAFVVY